MTAPKHGLTAVPPVDDVITSSDDAAATYAVTFPDHLLQWAVPPGVPAAPVPSSLEVCLWDAGYDVTPCPTPQVHKRRSHAFMGRAALPLSKVPRLVNPGAPAAGTGGDGGSGPLLPARFSRCDREALSTFQPLTLILLPLSDEERKRQEDEAAAARRERRKSGDAAADASDGSDEEEEEEEELEVTGSVSVQAWWEDGTVTPAATAEAAAADAKDVSAASAAAPPGMKSPKKKDRQRSPTRADAPQAPRQQQPLGKPSVPQHYQQAPSSSSPKHQQHQQAAAAAVASSAPAGGRTLASASSSLQLHRGGGASGNGAAPGPAYRTSAASG